MLEIKLIDYSILETFLSSIIDCSNEARFEEENRFYGNGLIRLTTQSIEGKDVEVCQLTNEDTGEKTNYLPVSGSANKMQE